jgi:hypothetical protein
MLLKLYDGEERILDFPVEYEMIYEVNHINDCINNGLLSSPIMDSETSIATSEIIENLINSF